MPAPYLILLLISIALFAYAWHVLSADAREGYDISMGGAMYFSGIWLLASIAASFACVNLLGAAWWWGIVLCAGLLLVKSVIYRIIVALYLGIDAPPLPKTGFKEFIRKTEEIRSETEDKGME